MLRGKIAIFAHCSGGQKDSAAHVAQQWDAAKYAYQKSLGYATLKNKPHLKI